MLLVELPYGVRKLHFYKNRVTTTNGKPSEGGAIGCSSSYVRLDNCVFDENKAGRGGAAIFGVVHFNRNTSSHKTWRHMR